MAQITMGSVDFLAGTSRSSPSLSFSDYNF